MSKTGAADPAALADLQNDPLLALEVLMPGFKLPPHQIITLLDFWKAEFCYSTSSRSTGKSALFGIALMLWCITHPGTKAGVLAQKYSSAKLILEFVEQLIYRYPMLQKCVVLTKSGDYCIHGSDKYIISFQNGSTLIALPSDIAKRGARVRGYRFNVLLIDEAVTIPFDIITAVFVPCCSIRDAQGNRKLVFTTTGGYKPSAHFDLCAKHFREASRGNDQYAFWNFTYLDVPEEFSYIVDRKAIKAMEEDSDPGTIARELYGLWTDAGGSYYQGGMLERNRLFAIEQGIYPEVVGEKGGIYVIGGDPAFRGSDHTAFVVLKRIAPRKWAVVHVFSKNFKSGWAEENARALLDLIERFHPVYIGLDRNGGEQLLHELTNYYRDNPDLCPIAMDAEPWVPGRRIARQFVPTSSGKDNNTRLNIRLLRALDGNGTPELIIPGASPSDDDDPEQYVPVDDMDKLITQLLSITATPIDSQPGLFKYASTIKKDRYSALLYAWNAAEELVEGEDDFDGAEGVTEQRSGWFAGRL